MSFHGGFLGVLIAMAIWGRKRGRNLMDIMDFIAPMVPLGYAAGRLGNFINAELPGRVADASLPWAMIWPNVDNLPRHPSPIYQMLVDGVLLFIILWIFARKPRPRMAVAGMFSLLYGCARFFTEYFRYSRLQRHIWRHHDFGRTDAVGTDDCVGDYLAGDCLPWRQQQQTGLSRFAPTHR